MEEWFQLGGFRVLALKWSKTENLSLVDDLFTSISVMQGSTVRLKNNVLINKLLTVAVRCKGQTVLSNSGWVGSSNYPWSWILHSTSNI